ncbi:beta-1,4-galactosyltransferase galt-1 [Magallana gigas]|uniref:beta-1,4-galactosyltransferase galt-1 n=1 Tax=Magallana gigas TaxID=29159 RepID=UPI0033408B33
MATRGRKTLRVLALIMFGYFMVTVYFYTRVMDKGREIRGSDDYSSLLDYDEEKLDTKRTKVDRKLKGHSDNVFIEYNEQLYQKRKNQEPPNTATKTRVNTFQGNPHELKELEESSFDKKIRESAIRLEEKMRQKSDARNKTSFLLKSGHVTRTHTTKYSIRQNMAESEETKTNENSNKNKVDEFIRNPNITIATANYNFLEIFPGVYLYSSFFDSREEANLIRFILIGRTRDHARLSCSLQTNETGEVFESEMQFYQTCESHMKENSVYLCSCEIPDKYGRIQRVNLTSSENPNTFVSIDIIPDVKEPPFKYKLSTCVPPLFGDINILRLTEFIEFSLMLGSEHIYFYYNRKRDDIYQLLQYYSDLGVVTFFPWKLTMESHEIWYHGQSAAIWDCQYRNIHVSELVSFNDIDEFIVPKRTNTWNNMLPELNSVARRSLSDKEEVAAFSFHSVFFDSNFRNNDPVIKDEYGQLLTVNVTLRTSSVSKVRTKMIVYPEKVFELGIHHLSKPMDDKFKSVLIPEDIALIHHYRDCDWNYGMNCDRIMKDNSMHRFKRDLLKRVKKSLFKFNRIEAGSSQADKGSRMP